MNKIIKDTQSPVSPQSSNSGGHGVSMSYNNTYQPAIIGKAGKLITALYMVTDIMDKDEPIKNKLRTLGTEIISDMHSVPTVIDNKITEIVSFLNIATAMSFISEMNGSILRKEFSVLQQSINESMQMKPVWLEEFLKDSSHEHPLAVAETSLSTPAFSHPSKGELHSKGHVRIGVQKRDNFLKILKDMSDRGTVSPGTHFGSDFDVLKKQRRNDIFNMIKIIGGSATITDIITKAQALPAVAGALASCSEKTLQRELMSMTKDSLLKKTGEKRWSRYSLLSY